MDRNHIKWVAIQMAIRHPSALKYTKELISKGFIKEINEDINNYLTTNFGLDFSYIDYLQEGYEIVKYVEFLEQSEYITIIKPDSIIYTGTFAKKEIETWNGKEEKNEEHKEIKSIFDKESLRISSITPKLLSLYDAKYILNTSLYSIKGTDNTNTRTKNKLTKLHNNILEKNWFKII